MASPPPLRIHETSCLLLNQTIFPNGSPYSSSYLINSGRGNSPVIDSACLKPLETSPKPNSSFTDAAKLLAPKFLEGVGSKSKAIQNEPYPQQTGRFSSTSLGESSRKLRIFVEKLQTQNSTEEENKRFVISSADVGSEKPDLTKIEVLAMPAKFLMGKNIQTLEFLIEEMPNLKTIQLKGQVGEVRRLGRLNKLKSLENLAVDVHPRPEPKTPSPYGVNGETCRQSNSEKWGELAQLLPQLKNLHVVNPHYAEVQFYKPTLIRRDPQQDLT